MAERRPPRVDPDADARRNEAARQARLRRDAGSTLGENLERSVRLTRAAREFAAAFAATRER